MQKKNALCKAIYKVGNPTFYFQVNSFKIGIRKVQSSLSEVQKMSLNTYQVYTFISLYKNYANLKFIHKPSAQLS